MSFEGFYGYKNGYSLNKTLHFELIPQGKTEENIKKQMPLTKKKSPKNTTAAQNKQT